MNGNQSTVVINGKDVQVAWTSAAARALAARPTPLVVELELYFSCLVKKFIHFRDDSKGRPVVAAHEKLHLYFRPVTSTACTYETAKRLGRQPEMDIDSPAIRKVAPSYVSIDFSDGAWSGAFGW